MEYAIQTLEKERRMIERNIRENNLMNSDMKQAKQEFSKVTALKKAIQILKIKNRRS